MTCPECGDVMDADTVLVWAHDGLGYCSGDCVYRRHRQGRMACLPGSTCLR